MALYDALQKRLNKGTAPMLAEAGATDTGSTMAAIGAAKGGKAGAPAPALPSLAEQAAAAGAVQDVKQAASQNAMQATSLGLAEQQEAAQTTNAESALQQQMQMGQASLAAQAATQRANVGQKERLGLQRLQSSEEMKRDAISAQAEDAIANLLSNKKINENDIFSQFHQDERELEHRRDAAALEQMGTMMALRDKSYVNEISRVGAVRNLGQQQNFEKESARLALGDQLSNYLGKLKWTEADLTDNLRFAEKMANMSVEQAWAIMKMASDSHNSSMVATGAGQLGGLATQYVFGQSAEPVKAVEASPNTIAYDKAYGEA